MVMGNRQLSVAPRRGFTALASIQCNPWAGGEAVKEGGVELVFDV